MQKFYEFVAYFYVKWYTVVTVDVSKTGKQLITQRAVECVQEDLSELLQKQKQHGEQERPQQTLFNV